MPARVLTASRRAALGLAAAGAAGLVSGCDADTPLPGGEEEPSPTATAPPQDADGRLVDRVRADVVATLTAVRAARGRPTLAPAVRALESLHLAHLAALEGEDPGRAPRRSAGTPDEVARQLAAREERHQQALARATERAVSGDLAALLATMTAGTAQHRGLLP